jgi:SAM-dependent methyltransferase
MDIKLFLKRAVKAVLPYGILKIYRYLKKQQEFKKLTNYCPVCKKTGVFKPSGVRPRPRVQCPYCGSLERHRLLWLFLQKSTDLFKKKKQNILHIAAEPFLEKELKKIHGNNYITADLIKPNAMVIMDITKINYSNETFDIIICNHVLEHIIDDIKAMSELYRVLKSSGWAVLLVPIRDMEKTYEDFSITTKEGRTKAFGQWDHVRYYGRDFIDRLKFVGFNVNVINANEVVKDKDIKKMNIYKKEKIFYCKRQN